ncbi:zona pellucida-like domain-containing protein 1 [Austrofundulus limnaeus]|uniref:Zona pellucida-like domain-containing protein 1 n=1 Tax=Austrofundulus limnaeus TaxID=52670 RepID=A0A2I4AZ03_AUSLI|nr:PREDICTED: zona pellucida-like domain-containing protein 1 [Austrofundulus limnaeus]
MILFLCLPLLAVLLQPALCLYNCPSVYNRNPNDSDLQVFCATNIITVEVNLCTAQWAGFNASELALNGKHNNIACLGSVDTIMNPPIIRFQFPVNSSQANSCVQPLKIVDEIPDPTGLFSGFSSIQSIIVTGYIDTPKSDQGVISYSTDLYYSFTCRYPLEYLLNNTEIAVSGISVATTQNNGSFIDTLRMNVFNDSDYKYPLVAPSKGLPLRTNIYVEIKTVNLTGNFYVLLDRCYATPSPYNVSLTEQQNFFTGCIIEDITTIINNGDSTGAHFYFEAFRFVQDGYQKKSTIYLHCLLRLCEPSACNALTSACYSKRRKRSLTPFGQSSSESAAISVGPLYTAGEELPVTAAHGNIVASDVNVVSATCLPIVVAFAWLLSAFF